MKDQSNVDRALAVLQYLAHQSGEHGVRALSVALGMSPSTVFRLLESLERTGFVAQNEQTSRYRIGMQAVQLGISALSSFNLTSIAPNYLHELVVETGESCFLGVLDDGEIVYLFKEEGHYAIRTMATLGSRRPVHCTALGKAFLAILPPTEAQAIVERKGMPALTRHTITNMERLWEELADIRMQGYAVDREEVEEGLICVAAPVRDYQGQTVAAISIAGPAGRMAPCEERYGRRIAATAREISMVLGYQSRAAPVEVQLRS